MIKYAWIGLFAFVACHSSPSLQKDRALQSLLDRSEYFKLRDSLPLYANEISQERRLFFEACLDNVFNRNGRSNQKIDSIWQDTAKLTDSLKANLLLLKADNSFKIYAYADAARAEDEVIHTYPHAIDSNTLNNIRNESVINNALKAVPAQMTMIQGNTIIPWRKDQIGLIEIPVNRKDSTYSCIFDTRANISTITETYATRMGLQRLSGSFNVQSGATGGFVRSTLGVADSLWIGKILVRHAVFMIMPDPALYIAPYKFSLNVILGYPIISQLKEVQINRNGDMYIPQRPAERNLHNLALDHLDPVVEAVLDGETLCFGFDTGAATSDLDYNYFLHRRDYILKNGKSASVHSGGAGGFINENVYKLDSVSLKIGNGAAALRHVGIASEAMPSLASKFYGNIGQDFIGQFGKMVLNFQSMYIDFE